MRSIGGECILAFRSRLGTAGFRALKRLALSPSPSHSQHGDSIRCSGHDSYYTFRGEWQLLFPARTAFHSLT